MLDPNHDEVLALITPAVHHGVASVEVQVGVVVQVGATGYFLANATVLYLLVRDRRVRNPGRQLPTQDAVLADRVEVIQGRDEVQLRNTATVHLPSPRLAWSVSIALPTTDGGLFIRWMLRGTSLM